MRSATAQAAALAAMLTGATGSEARLDEAPDRIRIEVDLPGDIAPITRTVILTVLTLGARYGHRRAQGGSIVWVEIDRETTS